MNKTISVIGGDLRQLTLYRELKKNGFSVFLHGFDRLKDADITDNTKLFSSDIIILPMPVTTDGVYINSVYSDSPITISRLLDEISPSAIVFGGQIKPMLSNLLKTKGITFFDYLNREELAVKNAVATAEGAISIAISETPYTVHNSRCLVLGYGRIGKILSKMLLGLGAKTTICARRLSDLALSDSFGFNSIPIKSLKNEISNYDIIFNTVPAMILDYDMLSLVNPDTLIIDLASKPGGVDFKFAKSSGVKAIWALSIPGKYAPVTSGKIIKDTIINILNELEV